MKKGNLSYLAQAGMIAAIYAALTYLAMVFNLAYGSIQFRFSEALTILPIFTPGPCDRLPDRQSRKPLSAGFDLRDGCFPDRRTAYACSAQCADQKDPCACALAACACKRGDCRAADYAFHTWRDRLLNGFPDCRRAGRPRPACRMLPAGPAAGNRAGEKRRGQSNISLFREKKKLNAPQRFATPCRDSTPSLKSGYRMKKDHPAPSAGDAGWFL